VKRFLLAKLNFKQPLLIDDGNHDTFLSRIYFKQIFFFCATL